MKFVSRLALAAVLSLGSTALTVAPAAAQKNKKGDNGPQLQVSDEYRKAIAPAEQVSNAINAKRKAGQTVTAADWAAAEPSIIAAEAVAKNDDEKYYVAYLRYLMDATRGNVAGQKQALAVLVVNPKTPAENRPIFQRANDMLLGSEAYSAGRYPEAIQLLTRARQAGATDLDIPLNLANAYSKTGKQAESVAEIKILVDAYHQQNRKPDQNWYKFAIPKVVALRDRAAMADWLNWYLTDYPTVSNWYWAVSVFDENAPKPTSARELKNEKLDLYRLKRATKALPDRGNYADYAYSAQSSGLPWEALSVIKEGRAAGKIPTPDSDVDRIYTAANTQVKSETSLDAIAKQGMAASTGTAAVQQADALLAADDNARALAVYDAALTKGGVDANEVNLHRGIALHRLGRKDEARAAFQAVTSGPLSNLATLWMASLTLPPLS